MAAVHLFYLELCLMTTGEPLEISMWHLARERYNYTFWYVRNMVFKKTVTNADTGRPMEIISYRFMVGRFCNISNENHLNNRKCQ
jgi:hypothetical protein